MSYTALYRKWRPAVFDDVKGQDHIVQTLKNQIVSGRVGHAYLFCGTRGTGKTSIAKIFAKAVNCEHPVDGSPCGECPVCRAIAGGASMNVVEIDAASNNGVENIRDIREQVQYPPTDGRYRVYIIDEVHMLSIGAFNALLKTLEEPPSYVIFILATTEVHKIPVTILSRCQRYDFKRIPAETIAARLREVTQAEQIEIEEKAVLYLAKAADGAFRDALSLLDQCIAFHFGETLTYDNVLDILGAVDQTLFSRMFQAIMDKRTKDCILILEEMVVQGRELGQFVNDFIWYLRNLLLVQTAEDAAGLVDMSEDNLKQLLEDGKRTDGNTLIRQIRVLSELSNQLRYASQKRILIEIALIKLTKPEMEVNIDSLLERVASLEARFEEGLPVRPGGYEAQAAGYGQVAAVPEALGGQPEEAGSSGAAIPPKEVAIPPAQLEDLKLIRNEWGNIVRQMGMSIRPSFRDTVVEPSGDSCLCIVFSDPINYAIGNRPSVIGSLERYVAEKYGKSIYFKTRQRETGERANTIYVSDEELREKIHMDISIEED
ncbi:MAG: DNA polymerase III subunit gamma/tau [Lachnospiraceae bacterium]|nr:DNA polymerase III subunit gamma/tau [Lachnospiraceae bacterium]